MSATPAYGAPGLDPAVPTAPSRDDRIRAALGGALTNGSNYPREVMVHVLGRNMGLLIAAASEAVIAAVDQAPATEDEAAEVARLRATLGRVRALQEEYANLPFPSVANLARRTLRILDGQKREVSS